MKDIGSFPRGLDDAAEAVITSNSYQIVIDRLRHHARTKKIQNASEWSGEFRHLPPGGRFRTWQTDELAFQHEPAEMMCSTHPDHRFVVVSKPSQVGFTDLAIGEILRRVDTDPTSIMYFRETGDKIKEFQRTRLFPALRLPPFHNRRDIEIKGEDVYFPGGYLVCRGVGSANALAGTTAQVCIGDEVAKMAESIGAGSGAGDFFSLASQRSSTFGDKAKAILFSTPRDQSESEGSFWNLVDRGDRRRYFCPCPKCKKDWDFAVEHIVKYEEGNKEHFGLKCPHCESIMREEERADAVRKGVWKATKNPRPGFVSYEVNGLHSWRTLRNIYHQYEDAVAGRGAMSTFLNEVLGEFHQPEEARRATPDAVQNMLTRKPYNRGTIPDFCSVLTMAIDVGAKQLDWTIVGWGYQFENAAIETGQLTDDRGELLTIDKTQDVMIAIRKLLETQWKRHDGKMMSVRLAAIDYGGPEGTTPAVKALLNFFPRVNYDKMNQFVPAKTLIAVKGINRKESPRLIMHTPGDRTSTGQRRRTPAFSLGTDRAKFELYRALRAPEDTEDVIYGRPHAPVDFDYPRHAQELVAEEVVVERDPKTGKTIQFFRNPPGKRNEQLDLWTYCRAAASILRCEDLTKEGWKQLRDRECYTPDKPKKEPPKPGSIDAQKQKMIDKRKAELQRRREARMNR